MTTRAARQPVAILVDLVTLTKPRLTALVLFTAAGGMLLAPGPLDVRRLVLLLTGTALVVGASHALNMYMERDIDALMSRTRNRPLPAGRLAPETAVWFGLLLALVGLPFLTLLVNPLTGALSGVALLSYVTLYTPLKRRAPSAVYVGAIPGALPPVLGWTAATGTLDWGALVLFAILFTWQIPHFLGLSLLLAEDYRAAGVQVMPIVSGKATTLRHIRVGAGALLLTSVLLVPAGLSGPVYGAGALTLGAWLVWRTLTKPGDDYAAWGRAIFLSSIVHLTALFVVLGLDALLR